MLLTPWLNMCWTISRDLSYGLSILLMLFALTTFIFNDFLIRFPNLWVWLWWFWYIVLWSLKELESVEYCIIFNLFSDFFLVFFRLVLFRSASKILISIEAQDTWHCSVITIFLSFVNPYFRWYPQTWCFFLFRQEYFSKFLR